MMRFLLLISVTVTTSYGSDWKDFRGGDVALPTKQKEAEELNWVLSEVDDKYQIQWFELDSDKSLSIGYDQKGNCAGVKTTWLESDIKEEFLQFLTSKKGKTFFESSEVNGEKAFKSTVLFTDEKVLKNGGRDLLRDDEFASNVFVKQGKGLKKLSREACVQVKAGEFYEQSCQSGKGLVLTNFGSETECDSVLPFYGIYDSNDSDYGDLLGFGWLLSTKTSKTGLGVKSLSAEYVQALFSKVPSCLSSFPDLTVVEVWLSHSDSLQTTCSEGSWIDEHCNHRISNHLIKEKKKKDKSGDSSDSSDSSDSDDSNSSENKKSFWKKLFG